MQVSRLRHEVLAGAQVQMVGVGEDDLGVQVLEFLRRNGLDGRLRADRHIHGGLDDAVRRMETAAAGAGIFVDVQKLKFKRFGHDLSPVS